MQFLATRIFSLLDKSFSDDLRSIIHAATIGTSALLVGAALAHPEPAPLRHSTHSAAWQTTCGQRCELETVSWDGDGHLVGLVYASATDARIVSEPHRPLGAAVTFSDGRRFVFDMCDGDSCRLPSADSAALFERLKDDDSGTLRLRSAAGGSNGLIELPRLSGVYGDFRSNWAASQKP